MIRRPPRSTLSSSSAASDVYKRQVETVESTLATVPEQNRLAWRLHHVLAGDTLDTIAKSYHLTPDRIASVNRAADSIEAGDVLLIPAVYREESSPIRSG